MQLNPNFLKGYRTLIVNGISLLIVVLTGLTGSIENPETLRYFTMGVLVLNLILRFLTTGPVPKPGDPV